MDAELMEEVGALAYNHKIDLQAWRLECVRHSPRLTDTQAAMPVLFLHGIFVGAWCWQHFLADFAEHGYDAWALSFRGHGDSSGGCEFGLADFIADAEAAVDEIKRVTGHHPIVVGHSMGGLVLQRLMLSRSLAGAVLLCSMPPQGLLPLAMSNCVLRPMEALTLAQLAWQQTPITAAQLKLGMFAQAIDDAEVAVYASQTVSESLKLWADLLHGSMLTPWLKSCPVAVMGASEDTLVPAPMTHLTALTYQVPVHWLHGFGHGVMLERDWPQAAAQLREVIAQL